MATSYLVLCTSYWEIEGYTITWRELGLLCWSIESMPHVMLTSGKKDTSGTTTGDSHKNIWFGTVPPSVDIVVCIPSMVQQTTSIKRGLVSTPLGLVHYVAVGEVSSCSSENKIPIVAFHMSPRSVDEYKEAMNESLNKGDNRFFVAMDEFGYGSSDNPIKSCTLDDIADCFKIVLNELEITKCVATGSLMGCYFALSLAARYPTVIQGVVCTNLYHFKTEARQMALQEALDRPSTGPIQDSWELKDDGSHISDIYPKRANWLSPALNTRATLDNLNYLVKRRDRYQQGIYIQDGVAFPLEETCAMVSCPVLCINGAAAVVFFDMIGMDMSAQFQQVLTFFPITNQPEICVMSNPGSINMINENADEWLEKVVEFADKL